MKDELEFLRELEQVAQDATREWRSMKYSEAGLYVSEIRGLISKRIIDVLESRVRVQNAFGRVKASRQENAK